MEMIPENASAFAVYSGKISSPAGESKKRKKSKKKVSQDNSLSKLEKIDKLLKKKEKKMKVISAHLGDNSLSNLGPFNPGKVKKAEKIIMLKNGAEKTEKKKSKKNKKKTSPSVEEPLSSVAVFSDNNETLKPCLSNAESDLSGLGSGNATFSIPAPLKEKKVKKKVQISSQLPVLKSDGTRSKVFVSTPRFNKRKERLRLTGTDSVKSCVLSQVDSYVSEKLKNRMSPSPGPSTSKMSAIIHKFADEAKLKAEKQGSKEVYGEPTFQSILEPFSDKSFFRDYWEKKPLHVPGFEKKFSSFISTELIDCVLRENIVLFGKHLDVTTYVDGVRETHNPEGRAHAHIVWDFYSNGCSVRLLNPQYFMNSIHLLNSNLQELFGCFVGANVYLTPPNTQGFAPHYDDIEAIILQVEGSKFWKIYSPIDKNGVLPRYSSRNLSDDEVGDPVLEVKLKAGDVLYFPRGFIHQARTEEEHSLHITISTYQQTSMCDLLEKLLPATLKKACSQDVEFRRGLPFSYLESAGFAYQNPSQAKKSIVSQLKQLITKMSHYLDVDTAVDEMGLKFIQEALPPVLTPREAACSVVGGGMRMEKNGSLTHHIFIPLDTRVRWIRKHCYRFVQEDVTLDDGLIEIQTRIYYSLDNSREYRKDDPQFLIIPPEMVPGVLTLTSAYPEYTAISDLPLPDDDLKITLIGDLWDRGLLVTDVPLEVAPEETLVGQPEEATFNKVEAEVFADLLEAIPHGSDNDDEMTEISEIETGTPPKTTDLSLLPLSTNGLESSSASTSSESGNSIIFQ